MEFNKNDKKFENKSKGKNLTRQIRIMSLRIICFLLVFLFVRGCTKAITSSIIGHKYSQKDYQEVKDASFVKGFEIVNTIALEEYCIDSGHVPNDYINQFKKSYYKTILNANNILEKYGTTKQIQKEIVEKFYQQSLEVLENDFVNLNTQYKISKKQYCQLFDEEANSILSEKLQIFKQQQPNMYLD